MPFCQTLKLLLPKQKNCSSLEGSTASACSVQHNQHPNDTIAEVQMIVFSWTPQSDFDAEAIVFVSWSVALQHRCGMCPMRHRKCFLQVSCEVSLFMT